MPSITQNRMRLARMTGAQALSAVVKPGGRLVSQEVAESIVRFVAGGSELRQRRGRAVAAEPHLPRAQQRAASRRAARRFPPTCWPARATRSSTEFYERALADQPAGVRRVIEDELLTESGYRESLAEERVRKALAAAGAAPDALATLVDRRLLRIEERLDMRRVELTHDVLVRRRARQPRPAPRARGARRRRERQLAEQREREAAHASRAGARAHGRRRLRGADAGRGRQRGLRLDQACAARAAADAAAQQASRARRGEAGRLPDRGFLRRARAHRPARHAGQARAHGRRLLRRPAAGAGHAADADLPRDGAGARRRGAERQRRRRCRVQEIRRSPGGVREAARGRRPQRSGDLRARAGAEQRRVTTPSSAAAMGAAPKPSWSRPPTCCDPWSYAPNASRRVRAAVCRHPESFEPFAAAGKGRGHVRRSAQGAGRAGRAGPVGPQCHRLVCRYRRLRGAPPAVARPHRARRRSSNSRCTTWPKRCWCAGRATCIRWPTAPGPRNCSARWPSASTTTPPPPPTRTGRCRRAKTRCASIRPTWARGNAGRWGWASVADVQFERGDVAQSIATNRALLAMAHDPRRPSSLAPILWRQWIPLAITQAQAGDSAGAAQSLKSYARDAAEFVAQASPQNPRRRLLADAGTSRRQCGPAGSKAPTRRAFADANAVLARVGADQGAGGRFRARSILNSNLLSGNLRTAAIAALRLGRYPQAETLARRWLALPPNPTSEDDPRTARPPPAPPWRMPLRCRAEPMKRARSCNLPCRTTSRSSRRARAGTSFRGDYAYALYVTR